MAEGNGGEIWERGTKERVVVSKDRSFSGAETNGSNSSKEARELLFATIRHPHGVRAHPTGVSGGAGLTTEPEVRTMHGCLQTLPIHA